MRRYRFIPLLALLALVSAITATLAPAAQARNAAHARVMRTYFGRSMHQLRFVFIVKTVNSDYWAICLAAGKKAAQDFGVQGLQFTGANSEANISGQISLMEDAIAKKPDFIVLAPTSRDPLDSVITKAYKAGIKVILIDSAASTSNYQTFLATDNYKGGQLAADALAAAIKRKTGAAKGQVAYSTFLSGVGSLSQRDQGFLDELKKYPGLQLVAHKDAGGDQGTKSIGIVADTLTAFPHLVGYFADNLYTLQGAETAFRERHVDKTKVSLVGFDASAPEIKGLHAGTIDGVILQDPYQMGYGGVAYGIMAAAGLNTPKFVDTGVAVATPENINTPKIQGLLDPIHKRNLGF